MGHFGEQLVTVLTAIVGLAIVAVLVSRNAQTAQVIGAGAQGFAQAIGAAVAPVTGQGVSFGPGFGFTGYGGFPGSL